MKNNQRWAPVRGLRRAQSVIAGLIVLAIGACTDAPVAGPGGKIPGTPAKADGALHVYTLPVEGQSVLVVGPTGETLLYDAGKDESAQGVLAVLSSVGVTHLDMVVLSHRHENHESGIVGLASSSLTVGSVMVSSLSSATRAAIRAEEAWRGMGAKVLTVRDTTVTLGGGAVVELIRSPLDRRTSDTTLVSHDDRSVTMVASFAGRKFLSVGDATARLETELWTLRPDIFLNITGLIVPSGGRYESNPFWAENVMYGASSCYVPEDGMSDVYRDVYSYIGGRPVRDVPSRIHPQHAIFTSESEDEEFEGCFRRVAQLSETGDVSYEYTAVDNTTMSDIYRRAGSIVHRTSVNGLVEFVVKSSGEVLVLHDEEAIEPAP